MAGWSTLREGYVVNFDENCKEKLKLRFDSVNVVSVEDDKDDENEIGMLRGLFDQVFVVLIRGFNDKNAIRPTPALVGDGRSVDLFRLFYLVRERGGFNSVSNEKLWGLIAESLDFDFRLSASLKLIYYKYLDELDQWLNRFSKDESFVMYGSEYDGILELLSVELEKRFRGLSVDDDKLVKIENEVIPAGCEKICESNVAVCDDDENVSKGEGDDRTVGRFDLGSFEKEAKNLKRKRQDWQKMLSWLQQVAMNPVALFDGRVPYGSSWNENDGKESLSLALLARDGMLKKKYPNSKDEACSPNQKKQKIDPTIYEDPAPSHLESVRYSKRVPALAKTPKCTCCDSSATKENRHGNHCKVSQKKIDTEEAKKGKKTPDPHVSQPSELTNGPSPDKRPVEKNVNVGPQYQAEIPPYTGEVSEEDCVRVGVRIWPPENREQNTFPTTRSILGKGRPDICACLFPGSVECVRFHTAENNLKLKHELGRAFYQWRIDKMGELVSLSWTPQEEERFKSVMSSVPLSIGKSSFRRKTRREFVDYYFNVFLQCKRRYQNRVTPNAVDSDDELSEFGSVGGLYGHAVTNASGSNPMNCVQNEQIFDVKVSNARKFCG